MRAITSGELLALEALIDKLGLVEVLSQISEICHAKAEHIAENWQDVNLAKTWTKAAMQIETLSKKVSL
jgi:hypothetical protein